MFFFFEYEIKTLNLLLKIANYFKAVRIDKFLSSCLSFIKIIANKIFCFVFLQKRPINKY